VNHSVRLEGLKRRERKTRFADVIRNDVFRMPARFVFYAASAKIKGLSVNLLEYKANYGTEV
jgi:hypothetical protein